ncbi:hypothetical protein SAMN04488505_101638 [Chitinophaga rupis]|uniref:MerR, DNA binding n=1 Tax=Chitinophaga rupis TaxID=573321 RepID=A0A1H7ISW2_9BACT|nr:hypothetical protein [Chitinophaga rupis]SEK65364.1 hypothetical protein SAMN04488505_101638 [Chitinophaga rupis]
MMAAQEAICGQVGNVLAQKIALVNNKIQQLIAMRDQLLYSIQCCTNAGNQANTNCPIICA